MKKVVDEIILGTRQLQSIDCKVYMLDRILEELNLMKTLSISVASLFKRYNGNIGLTYMQTSRKVIRSRKRP